jgi:polygalacturonase
MPKCFYFLFCALAFFAPFSRAQTVNWNSVPAILARIKPPEFPPHDFLITDFGAKGDNATDCTDAIAQAIAACHKAGGGRVLITNGIFLTGALHLLSNVNLHIAAGTTLKFLPDPKKFLPVVFTRFEGTECMNYSPLIYAFEQENIAITGSGTLDGSGAQAWWPLMRNAQRTKLTDEGDNNAPVAERIFGEGSGLRPSFIEPFRCRNVLVDDIHIVNSPMWELHPLESTNVTIRNVNISSHGANNDGCDPESSTDVLIENCVFDTGDDCIAIKSGKNADGRRVNIPSENIIIRNCVMKDGHGGVVVGSEISGSVRNVFAENCTMDSANLERVLRLKSNALRGGSIENIFMRNIDVGFVKSAVLTIDLVYDRVNSGPFPPTVRNVHMEHVTTANSRHVLDIAGTTNSVIADIHVEDCAFRGVRTDDTLVHAGTISTNNITRDSAEGPSPVFRP